MIRDMEKCGYVRKSARRLCENRCNYNFKGKVEKGIIDEVKQKNDLDKLVYEIITLLHGEDGNIRIGAAEILGVITPVSMVNIVLKELEKHLDDDFVRDFVYGGFQGDEEDLRTVAECSKLSIDKLNKLITGS